MVFLKQALDRVEITRRMFDLAEFGGVLEAARVAGVPDKRIDIGLRNWRKQFAGDQPTYSEYDLAMAAWLGSRLMLASPQVGKPWVGAERDRITHMVLDEAQDLSPCHIATFRSMLAPGGTITMVGDLRQNLHPLGGIRKWEEVGITGLQRAAFTVVYRQTREIGTFIQSLQSGLFRDKPTWTPSYQMTGPKPRAGKVRSWRHIAAGVAAEARLWRERTAGATVAVLYDGKVSPKRLRQLRDDVAAALQDQITSVHLIEPRSRGGQLRETDCVIIASVRQTKGLEFDAVVLIEIRPDWARSERDVDVRIRNGLYVAASRARNGLSFCMRQLPRCFNRLAKKKLLEPVKWPLPQRSGE
jgi:hypothetical protein